MYFMEVAQWQKERTNDSLEIGIEKRTRWNETNSNSIDPHSTQNIKTNENNQCPFSFPTKTHEARTCTREKNFLSQQGFERVLYSML